MWPNARTKICICTYKAMIGITSDEKKLILKEIIAKGLAVMILVAWVAVLTYQNFNLNRKVDAMQQMMWQMQNEVIKDNTKALYEFNLKSK